MSQPLRKIAIAAAIAAASIMAPLTSPTAHAAGSLDYYVDGKTGSDTNTGASAVSAFKTIQKALSTKREPGHIWVKGYTDYVYNETMDRGWYLPGTATDPVIIEPLGWGTSAAIRPFVSGGVDVTGPWYQPDPARYPHVWATAWTQAIPGYETSLLNNREERLYLDGSQPMHRPTVRPTLAELEQTPASQYWDGSTLFVRLGVWSGSFTNFNPAGHKITIPTYLGLLASSGSSYVTIRGFRVRHTTMGVGFTGTSHHNTVSDTDASYNYRMGFFTQSSWNVFERLSGSRNTIQLVKIDNGATDNILRNTTGYQNLGQGVKITGPSTARNQVRNAAFGQGSLIPKTAANYGGQVQGIDIEQGAHDNLVTNVKITDMARGVMLYQLDATGTALSGNRFQFLWLEGNESGVFIWDGRVGAASTGSTSFFRNTYVGNRIAIMVEAPTQNKSFDHETIYNTGTTATENQSGVYLKGGSISIINSIIDRSGGYAVKALAGSSASIRDSDVYRSGLGHWSGSIDHDSSVISVPPDYMSEVRSSGDFLKLNATSPLIGGASDGRSLGSRY